MIGWNIKQSGPREVAQSIKLHLMATNKVQQVHMMPGGEVVVGEGFDDESLVGAYSRSVTVKQLEADLVAANRALRRAA